MKLLTLLFILSLSVTGYASDFFDHDLDHLDRIEIGSDIQAEGTYTVQYPGLGTRGFNHKDCLLLSFGRAFPSKEQLKRLQKQIIITDGDGVLFPGGQHRTVNVLKGKEMRLNGGHGRIALAYYLEDIGTYVTGVQVKAWSPYTSITQILEAEFKEAASEVELIFLRGCTL